MSVHPSSLLGFRLMRTGASLCAPPTPLPKPNMNATFPPFDPLSWFGFYAHLQDKGRLTEEEIERMISSVEEVSVAVLVLLKLSMTSAR